MKNSIEKKILSIGLIVLGVAVLVFAIYQSACVPFYTYRGTMVGYKIYGGDAYTGIQNAAADAANNIYALNVEFCNTMEIFSSILICLCYIVALLLILIGVTKAISAFRKNYDMYDEDEYYDENEGSVEIE